MSIDSIHSRITQLQLRHNTLRPVAARSTVQQADFSELLRVQMQPAVQEPQPVDVAAAMAAARPTPDQGIGVSTLEVTSARTGSMISPVAAWSSQVNGAFWTGAVDSSDRAVEKAEPYMSIVSEASAAFGVPMNVILGVIRAESDFNPNCVSYAGAKGLMQIMPANEKDYGVTDPYDARQNIFCGTHEISDLLKRYNGDLKLALAAYNTGPGNIAKRGVTSSSDPAYGSVPQSVRAYADRVLRYAGLSS